MCNRRFTFCPNECSSGKNNVQLHSGQVSPLDQDHCTWCIVYHLQNGLQLLLSQIHLSSKRVTSTTKKRTMGIWEWEHKHKQDLLQITHLETYCLSKTATFPLSSKEVKMTSRGQQSWIVYWNTNVLWHAYYLIIRMVNATQNIVQLPCSILVLVEYIFKILSSL